MVYLQSYLILGAALFCIGLFGVLSKRNAVAILMGVELMLNAVNITLVGFSRFGVLHNPTPGTAYPALPTVATHGTTMVPADTYTMVGQVFTIFIITVAAAEAAVALAIMLALYRSRDTIDVNDATSMKG